MSDTHSHHGSDTDFSNLGWQLSDSLPSPSPSSNSNNPAAQHEDKRTPLTNDDSSADTVSMTMTTTALEATHEAVITTAPTSPPQATSLDSSASSSSSTSTSLSAAPQSPNHSPELSALTAHSAVGLFPPPLLNSSSSSSSASSSSSSLASSPGVTTLNAKQLAKIQKVLTRLQADNSNLQAEVSTLRSQLSSLQSQLASTRQSLSSAEHLVEELREQVDPLETELAESQQFNAIATVEKNELVRLLKEKTDSVVLQSTTVKTLQEENYALRQRISEQREMNEFGKGLILADREILRKDVEEKQNQILAMKEKLVKLEEEKIRWAETFPELAEKMQDPSSDPASTFPHTPTQQKLANSKADTRKTESGTSATAADTGADSSWLSRSLGIIPNIKVRLNPWAAVTPDTAAPPLATNPPSVAVPLPLPLPTPISVPASVSAATLPLPSSSLASASTTSSMSSSAPSTPPYASPSLSSRSSGVASISAPLDEVVEDFYEYEKYWIGYGWCPSSWWHDKFHQLSVSSNQLPVMPEMPGWKWDDELWLVALPPSAEKTDEKVDLLSSIPQTPNLATLATLAEKMQSTSDGTATEADVPALNLSATSAFENKTASQNTPKSSASIVSAAAVSSMTSPTSSSVAASGVAGVKKDPVDALGWEYAITTFRGDFHPSMGALDRIRRRHWQKKRVRILSAEEEQSRAKEKENYKQLFKTIQDQILHTESATRQQHEHQERTHKDNEQEEKNAKLTQDDGDNNLAENSRKPENKIRGEQKNESFEWGTESSILTSDSDDLTRF